MDRYILDMIHLVKKILVGIKNGINGGNVSELENIIEMFNYILNKFGYVHVVEGQQPQTSEPDISAMIVLLTHNLNSLKGVLAANAMSNSMLVRETIEMLWKYDIIDIVSEAKRPGTPTPSLASSSTHSPKSTLGKSYRADTSLSSPSDEHEM